MNIDSFANLFLLLAFIVPGFIFDSITRKILPQNQINIQSAFLKFLIASCVNYTIWIWVFFWMYQTRYYINHPFWTVLVWVIVIFISPVFLGFIWGLVLKHKLLEKAGNQFGISTINPIPTSWDYKFSKISSPNWILVTLKDGSLIAGYWGSESFSSSETNARDVYIEKVFQINSEGPWSSTKYQNDGILITQDQIKTIEFFKNQELLDDNK